MRPRAIVRLGPSNALTSLECRRSSSYGLNIVNKRMWANRFWRRVGVGEMGINRSRYGDLERDFPRDGKARPRSAGHNR